MSSYPTNDGTSTSVGDGFLSRRDLLKGLGVGAAGISLGVGLNIHPVAAQSENIDRVIAFYRFYIGDYEVTVINDGLNPFPPGFLAVNADEDDVTALLQDYHLPTNIVPFPMGTVVVNTGDRKVLLDTGAGTSSFIRENMGENTGGLHPTLAMLGVPPEEITDVVLSHYHPDHVGGLQADGSLAFPNAQHHLPQIEWDFLQSDGIVDFLVPFVDFANEQLQPVVANDGQLAFFGDEDEVVPGIQAVATLGHSIGHHSFIIESSGQQMLLTFDAITHPVFSLRSLDWVSAVDQIPDQTVETRRNLLARIVDEQLPVLAYHFPFPGIGMITRDGDSYRFIPTG